MLALSHPLHTCTHVHKHTRKHTHTSPHYRAHSHHTHMRAQTRTHTHLHTYTHTHTHTHTQPPSISYLSSARMRQHPLLTGDYTHIIHTHPQHTHATSTHSRTHKHTHTHAHTCACAKPPISASLHAFFSSPHSIFFLPLACRPCASSPPPLLHLLVLALADL